MSWDGFGVSWDGFGVSWDGFGVSWDGFGVSWDGFGVSWDGFGVSWDGFGVSWDGFGVSWDGFGVSWDGFGVSWDGFGVSWDGFGVSWDGFPTPEMTATTITVTATATATTIKKLNKLKKENEEGNNMKLIDFLGYFGFSVKTTADGKYFHLIGSIDGKYFNQVGSLGDLMRIKEKYFVCSTDSLESIVEVLGVYIKKFMNDLVDDFIEKAKVPQEERERVHIEDVYNYLEANKCDSEKEINIAKVITNPELYLEVGDCFGNAERENYNIYLNDCDEPIATFPDESPEYEPKITYLDEVEDECWGLFKKYSKIAGVEFFQDENGDDINFDITKEISEKIIKLVEKEFSLKFPIYEDSHTAKI